MFAYEQFVLGNIYTLIALNVLVITITLLYKIIRDWSKLNKTNKIEKMKPAALEIMQDIKAGEKHMALNKKSRLWIFRTMLAIAKETGQDYHEAFDSMGFTRQVMEDIRHKNDYSDLRMIKILFYIRSPLALPVLIKEISSHNVEKAYRAAYALGVTQLNDEQKAEVIEALLKSHINQERIVELLILLSPDLDMIYNFVQQKSNEKKRVILFKTMSKHPQLLNREEYIDLLQPYLGTSINIDIAVLEVLNVIGGTSVLQVMAEFLKGVPPWEIRARIARFLSDYPPQEAIPLLLRLGSDESWWVRFNSLHSLSKLGQYGLDALLDLATESQHLDTVNMAYQMLNASTGVYHTVKNIEGMS